MTTPYGAQSPYDPAAEPGDPHYREPASQAEADARTAYIGSQPMPTGGRAFYDRVTPAAREPDPAADPAERAYLAQRAHDHEQADEAWHEYERLRSAQDLQPGPDQHGPDQHGYGPDRDPGGDPGPLKADEFGAQLNAAAARADREGDDRRGWTVLDPHAPGGVRQLGDDEHDRLVQAVRDATPPEPDDAAGPQPDSRGPVVAPAGEHDRRPGEGRDELAELRDQAAAGEQKPADPGRGLDGHERERLLDAVAGGAGPAEREQLAELLDAATTDARARELQAHGYWFADDRDRVPPEADTPREQAPERGDEFGDGPLEVDHEVPEQDPDGYRSGDMPEGPGAFVSDDPTPVDEPDEPPWWETAAGQAHMAAHARETADPAPGDDLERGRVCADMS